MINFLFRVCLHFQWVKEWEIKMFSQILFHFVYNVAFFCSVKGRQILSSWGRFVKGGINYTTYYSYSRDKSAILGIVTPGIKWVPGSTIYPWNSYSRDKFSTLGINLPAKGIPTCQVWREIKCDARYRKFALHPICTKFGKLDDLTISPLQAIFQFFSSYTPLRRLGDYSPAKQR